MLILVSSILGVACYRHKHRNISSRRQQVDQAAPTLRRVDSNFGRDSHIYGSGPSPASAGSPHVVPNPQQSSFHRPAPLHSGDVYATLDARQYELTARGGSSSAERAGIGSKEGRRVGPGGPLTRVQVGEDLYTVPNKVRPDTAKSSGQRSADRSESDVVPARYRVGEVLYTALNKTCPG